MVQRAKKRNSLKTYKKQKQPKRSTKQAASVKTRSRKLYDHVLSKSSQCILMDDETYVKLDYKSLPGPQYYTVKEGTDIPESEKSIFCEKFGKKVLVWQAICSCGIKSSPFITNQTLNADIYRKECLQKRLLPVIKKHRIPPLFWPDLATCHYATSGIEWYRKNNIQFVEKHLNPPNCPQLRPIEKYWALMKSSLRKNGKLSNDIVDFKKEWSRISKMFTKDSVQRLMRGVKSKVRKLAKKKKNLIVSC